MPSIQETKSKLWWDTYCKLIQTSIDRQLAGNLEVYKEAFQGGDRYARQLVDLGYNFDIKSQHAGSFKSIMAKLMSRLEYTLGDTSDKITPHAPISGRKFVKYFDNIKCEAQPSEWELGSHEFMSALACGVFPVGYRTETLFEFQSLVEHDLSHLMAFIACPLYMKLARQIAVKVIIDFKIEVFDAPSSLLNLAIYYFYEEVVIVQDKDKRSLIQLLYPFNCDKVIHYEDVARALAKIPKQSVIAYMNMLYTKVLSIFEPLGGQSRDIVMRSHKFKKDDPKSKFHQSSIYYFYYNGLQSQELEKHAKFISSLIVLIHLDISHWASAMLDRCGRKHNHLIDSLKASGIWDFDGRFYRAFGQESLETIC